MTSGEVVVAANYNCPGQLVISGSIKGVNDACEKLKAAGAKRALILPVGGAFHSPFTAARAGRTCTGYQYNDIFKPGLPDLSEYKCKSCN